MTQNGKVGAIYSAYLFSFIVNGLPMPSFRLSSWISPAVFAALLLSACGKRDAGDEQAPEAKPPVEEDLSSFDSDNDGLSDADELRLGTDPGIADTDGDGFSDSEELLTYNFDPRLNPYRFNPVISDLPRLQLQVVSQPRILITHSDSTGKSTTIENSSSREKSFRTSTSVSVGESKRRELSATASYSVTTGVQAGVTKSGSVTGTMAKETSVNTTRDTARENRNTLSRSRSFMQNNDITKSGGEVEMALDISNIGYMAFTIETLGINLVKVMQDGSEINIGRLVPRGGSTSFFSQGTLRPGESIRNQLFHIADINLSKVESLLQPGAFVIRSEEFELLDQHGGKYDHRSTEFANRTVLVTLDYGPGTPSEEYYVAVPASYDDRISVQELLEERLHIPIQSGTLLWNYGDEVRASHPGLIQVREHKADSKTRSLWTLAMVTQQHNRAENQEVAYNLLKGEVDLSQLKLSPTQQLHLTYITDEDGDGLGNRTEFLLGTDTNKADTDEDGMEDGEEVTVGRDPLLDDSIPLPNVADVDLERLGRMVQLTGTVLQAVQEEGYGVEVAWGDGTSERLRMDQERFHLRHVYPTPGNYFIQLTPKGPGFRRGKILEVPVKVQQQWKAVWARPLSNRSVKSEGMSKNVADLVTAPDGSVYAAVGNQVTRFDAQGEFRWLSKWVEKYYQISSMTAAPEAKGGVWVNSYETASTSPNSIMSHLNLRGEKLWQSKSQPLSRSRLIPIEGGRYLRRISKQRSKTSQVQILSPELEPLSSVTFPFASGYTYTVGELNLLSDQSYACFVLTRDPYGVELKRMNADGSESWSQSISSNNDTRPGFVKVNDEDDIFMIGITLDSLTELENHGVFDIYVKKFTAEGELIWTRQLGSSKTDLVYAAECDSRGYLHLAGHSHGVLGEPGSPTQSSKKKTAFHMVMNPEGEVIHLLNLPAATSEVSAMALDSQDNVYLGLRLKESEDELISSIQGDSDNVILKLERIR